MKQLANIFSIPNQLQNPQRTEPYIKRLNDVWTQITFDNGHWIKYTQDAATSMLFAHSNSCETGMLTRYTSDQFVEYCAVVKARQPYPTNYTNINMVVEQDQLTYNKDQLTYNKEHNNVQTN